MSYFDTFPRGLPMPNVLGSVWYRGTAIDTFVLSLPQDGLIVYHRHIWARTDDPTGGAYRCTFVYADGTMCGTMWSIYAAGSLPEWGEKFFTLGVLTLVAEHPRKDERPHSRACGITIHDHGPGCAADCPTCIQANLPRME